MAVTVFARYPGLSPQVYDEVVATLDLDANPPIGAILHLVGESQDALQVAEIWRTEQSFQAFQDRFHAVAADAGLPVSTDDRDRPTAQPVRGRDGDDRANGRGVAARDVCRCGAVGAPHPQEPGSAERIRLAAPPRRRTWSGDQPPGPSCTLKPSTQPGLRRLTKTSV